MASRSIRNRIRYQIEQIAKKQEACIEHLHKAYDISLGQHPELNAMLPSLIEALEKVKTFFLEVRDKL